MTYQSGLFEGRTVIVTGGTTGIGAATAARFAALGADVTVCGLNASEAPEGVTSREVNVLEAGALEAFFADFDSVDILVNSVGVSRDRNEWQKQRFDEVMAINLTSVMDACRLARPKLSKGGSIVNIASMYATFGAADRPGYAASKGAIVQLTKSLAQEYASAGIRVNAVAPGWIVTPLSRELFADRAASDPIKARIPAGRWGEADEVADAIVFMTTDAALYVTGVSLPVDGGYLTA